MMLERAALEQLDREALITLVLAQQARIAALETQLATLAAQVEAMSGDPPAPPAGPARPAFVKPACPPKPAPRIRKPRQVNFARRRETPTRIIEYAVTVCPDCGTGLSGGEVVRRRVCPHCQRVHTPPLDLRDQVLGHHRVSRDTMALIATLHTVGRLPVRVLQWVLAALHGLHLSVGALVGILRAVADQATPVLATLRQQVRGSPVVCADETGWREDGTNGYVWIFTTPTHCYFHYAPSRAGAVVVDVLGAVYEGTLVSDFYAAYTIHAGPHQRCWAHLLRDIHELRGAHPDDHTVATWADAVHALYLDAKQVAMSAADLATRVAARAALERQLTACCRPYWGPAATAPQTTLCQRIDRFLDELFEFVLDPTIPADNNLAERRLRPLVIARKISGGTRSGEGSRVRLALASLSATWQAQGCDLFQAYRTLLGHPAPTL